MKKEKKEKEAKMNAVAQPDGKECPVGTAVLVVVPQLPAVVEPDITMAMIEKPKRRSYVRKAKVKAKQPKTNKEVELQQKIIGMLKCWAFSSTYKNTVGGMLTNLYDAFQLEGYRVSIETLRSQITKLAEDGEIFCERMIYDPKRTYVKTSGKVPKGFFVEFYVALYSDSGERGLTEHVYYTAYSRS